MEPSFHTTDVAGEWFFKDSAGQGFSSLPFSDDLPTTVHLWDLSTSGPVPELANPCEISQFLGAGNWLPEETLDVPCGSAVHSSALSIHGEYAREGEGEGEEDSQQDPSVSCLYTTEAEEESDITASFLCHTLYSGGPCSPTPCDARGLSLRESPQTLGVRPTASGKLKPGTVRLRGIINPRDSPSSKDALQGAAAVTKTPSSGGGNVSQSQNVVLVQRHTGRLRPPASSPWTSGREKEKKEGSPGGGLQSKDPGGVAGPAGASARQPESGEVTPTKGVDGKSLSRSKNRIVKLKGAALEADGAPMPQPTPKGHPVSGSPSHSPVPVSPQLSRTSEKPKFGQKRNLPDSDFMTPHAPDGNGPRSSSSREKRGTREARLSLKLQTSRVSVSPQDLNPEKQMRGAISPFSLVKPNSVDGSLTLKDLNHMISKSCREHRVVSSNKYSSSLSPSTISPPSPPSASSPPSPPCPPSSHDTCGEAGCGSQKEMGGQGASARKNNSSADNPVLHITRLRTLGNGTITIKRTQS